MDALLPNKPTSDIYQLLKYPKDRLTSYRDFYDFLLKINAFYKSQNPGKDQGSMDSIYIEHQLNGLFKKLKVNNIDLKDEENPLY